LCSIADYRVQKCTYGFAVWCFFGWHREKPGWRAIALANTAEAGWTMIRERLGLEPKQDHAPVYVPAVIQTGDYELY
jgi:hypothetical protein